MHLVETLINATQDIFSNMVMLGITPSTEFERPDEPLRDGISGIIEFDGKYRGLLAIHLPRPAALEVSGAFLDLELEEIDEDVCDSVGELANMLAGNLKAELDPGGNDIQLGIPQTLFGAEYRFDPVPEAAKVAIPFYLDNGDFLVELQIKSAD